MSVLQDAFDNSPVLTRDDVPDNTPLPIQRSKTIYTNIDEETGVKQMPTYIQEGEIRYSAYTKRKEEGDQYVVGGGGTSGFTGWMYLVSSVVREDASRYTVKFKSAYFSSGLLKELGADEAGFTFQSAGLVHCSGDIEDVVTVAAFDETFYETG